MPTKPPGRAPEKLCIFCGLAPVEKTDEHVIPQWLIEMTGPRNRRAHFGIDWYRAKPRSYSFNTFVFPACGACNQRYSSLEGEVSVIMTDLLARKRVPVASLVKLLDWFDKVRVGIWLGLRYLDRNFWNITPLFHVDQRVGRHDRALVIYGDPTLIDPGITVVGVDTPVFSYMPSCFAMRINDAVFVNLSSPYFVAERLGFPYPLKEGGAKRAEGGPLFCFTQGAGQAQAPVLVQRPPPGGITLVQPMFQEYSALSAWHNNQYILKYSLDLMKGIGRVFDGDTGQVLGDDLSISDGEVDWEAVQAFTLRMQRVLWSEAAWMNPASTERPEFLRTVSAGQRKIEGMRRPSRRFRRYRGSGR